MIRSIFRILGRISLILIVAALVSTLAYAFSTRVSAAAPRIRPAGEQAFSPPSDAGELPARPARRPDGDGFRENGSLARGLFEVLSNILMISIFIGIGLVIFRRDKRPLPDPVEKQS